MMNDTANGELVDVTEAGATGIVPVEPSEKGAVADLARRPTLTLDTVRDMEQQAALWGRLQRSVVAMTTAAQWIDFGGNPYMEGVAAQTIAAGLGLTLQYEEPIWKSLPGKARQVCIYCVVSKDGSRPIRDVGDCDTFDPFVSPTSKRVKELTTARATPEQIAAIIEVDMVKKAQANAASRAVGGWAGLRGLTWDDLGKLGLDRSGAGANVTFGQGKDKPQSQASPSKPKATVDPNAARVAVADLALMSDEKIQVVVVATVDAVNTHTFDTGKVKTLINVHDSTGEAVLVWWHDSAGLAPEAVIRCAVQWKMFRNERQYTVVSDVQRVKEQLDEPDGT